MHHNSQAVGHIWYRCCLKHQKKHAIFFNTGFLNCLVNKFFFWFFLSSPSIFLQNLSYLKRCMYVFNPIFSFFRLHDLIFVIISGIYNETFINNKINVKISCLLSVVVVFFGRNGHRFYVKSHAYLWIKWTQLDLYFFDVSLTMT